MSQYTQITLDNQLNPNKHQAQAFAHICLYDQRKHIKGNTYEIITEHHLGSMANGKVKASARYAEKLARIAAITPITIDKINNTMALLALGMDAQNARVLLTEAYRRVIREQVETAPFAFIVFETVEHTQDMSAQQPTTTATQHTTPTPTGAATGSRPTGELNLQETAHAS